MARTSCSSRSAWARACRPSASPAPGAGRALVPRCAGSSGSAMGPVGEKAESVLVRVNRKEPALLFLEHGCRIPDVRRWGEYLAASGRYLMIRFISAAVMQTSYDEQQHFLPPGTSGAAVPRATGATRCRPPRCCADAAGRRNPARVFRAFHSHGRQDLSYIFIPCSAPLHKNRGSRHASGHRPGIFRDIPLYLSGKNMSKPLSQRNYLR